VPAVQFGDVDDLAAASVYALERTVKAPRRTRAATHPGYIGRSGGLHRLRRQRLRGGRVDRRLGQPASRRPPRPCRAPVVTRRAWRARNRS